MSASNLSWASNVVQHDDGVYVHPSLPLWRILSPPDAMRVLTTPATMRLTLLLHFLTISFAAVAIVTLRLCIRSLSKFRFPVIKTRWYLNKYFNPCRPK